MKISIITALNLIFALGICSQAQAQAKANAKPGLGTQQRPLINCYVVENDGKFPDSGGTIYVVGYRKRVIGGKVYANTELSINGKLYPDSSIALAPAGGPNLENWLVAFRGPGTWPDEIPADAKLFCQDPQPPGHSELKPYPNVY